MALGIGLCPQADFAALLKSCIYDIQVLSAIIVALNMTAFHCHPQRVPAFAVFDVGTL
jgi:hypothetical protein